LGAKFCAIDRGTLQHFQRTQYGKAVLELSKILIGWGGLADLQFESCPCSNDYSKKHFAATFFGWLQRLVPTRVTLGGGGFSSRCRCLADSMKKGHILCQTCNQEHHCRGKCRAGARIDALTTSPVDLTVERGVDGAPATLNLCNVPYFLLRALNQVDAAQHRTSAGTTHGQWATVESVPDPSTSASSAQVHDAWALPW